MTLTNNSTHIWHFCKDNFQLFIFCLVAFLTPLTFGSQGLLFGLMALSSIPYINRKKLKSIKFHWLIILPLIYFAISFIGIFNSENTKIAHSIIQTKLSFLFIPLIIWFCSDKLKENLRLILNLFVIGTIVACIYCLIVAFINSIGYDATGHLVFDYTSPKEHSGVAFFEAINRRTSNFSYQYLSCIHHPSYFAVYVSLSISIILFKFKEIHVKRYLKIGILMFLVFMTYLLASRAAYIVLITLFFLYFAGMTLKSSYKIIYISLFLITIIAGIFLVKSNNRINKNYNEIKALATQKETLNEKSDIRLWLWKTGIETFLENPWGYGLGDSNDVLMKKYIAQGNTNAINHSLNTHNQYIDESIRMGVFSLGCLLFWIIYSIIISIKKRDWLMFTLFHIFSINMLFESMFLRIAGIGCFALFYTIFVIRMLETGPTKLIKPKSLFTFAKK